MVNKSQFRDDYIKRLTTKSGRTIEEASRWDQYHALASLIRQYATEDWIETNN
jgi:starch phosphorylase